MAKIIKLITHYFKNESRDKKEISLLKELGHELLIVAKGKENGYYQSDGFYVYGLSTKPLGNIPFLLKLNRLCSIITWSYYISKANADMISCHDLIALCIGWLSNSFKYKRNRAKLIYDSHEFELGRNAKRNYITIFFIKHIERFLIKRCAFSIMVNNSIADEVVKKHNLQKRPIVVRNFPPYWNIDRQECFDIRKKYAKDLGVDINTFMIMYHGAVTNKRGIEMIIESLSLFSNVVFIILGNVFDQNYKLSLIELATKFRVNKRIIFYPYVDYKNLCKYIGAVDLEIIISEMNDKLPKSYYLSSPNKLFEAIQAEIPIIACDFPEISKVVNGFCIGYTIKSTNIADLEYAIRLLKDNNAYYNACVKNMRDLKKKYCWDIEKKILIEAYENLSNV